MNTWVFLTNTLTAACMCIQGGKPFGKQHWSTKGKTSCRPSWSADDDVGFGNTQKSSDVARVSDSSLWVDNYKPTNLRQIIGQQGDKSSAHKLYVWLSNWRNNFWKKPVCTLCVIVLKCSQYLTIFIITLLNCVSCQELDTEVLLHSLLWRPKNQSRLYQTSFSNELFCVVGVIVNGL